MDELERDLALRLQAAASKPAAERQAEVLQALGGTVSKALGLGPAELAILLLSPDRTMLRFVYPQELAEGGSNIFPLTVPSLAGRVVQTGRSILLNTARDVPHLAIYERIRIKGAKPAEIQKLLAVAVKGTDGRPLAVIEVSRRGKTLAQAGPDFRPADQEVLERLAAAAAGALHQAFAP